MPGPTPPPRAGSRGAASVPGVGGAQSIWSATFTPHGGQYESGLTGDIDVDVAIVGAGYTGLWTALSLAEADPGLRIVVLERQRVGFGASGRNGGWCSALLPISLADIDRRHGRAATIEWQREMIATVDAVGGFAARSRIDPHFHKGGTLTLAHNGSQLRRLKAYVDEARRFELGEDDVRLLDAAGVAEHCRAGRVIGAAFSPHCAAVHPLRLAHAIGAAAVAAGVRVVEGVEVVGLEPRRITATGGAVGADVVVLATEAYRIDLPGRRREVLPIYSLMIGSDALDNDVWEQIGLADRQTFSRASHLVIYGQRTADGRLAFGGRGAPYHYGSRIDDRFDTDERVRHALHDTVASLFPALAGIDFSYHWGGALAAPRDWHPHVVYDEPTGLASAGGYVGDGVAAANLAGRTLADLILKRDTDITRLPWVGHRSRRWEPEPLRWLGVNLVAFAANQADAAEASTGRFASRRAAAWRKVVERLGGR